MRILFQMLTVAAMILIGFYFYIVGKGILNPPEVHVEKIIDLVVQDVGTEPEGEKLFQANCTACHKINGKLVGPALAGVNEKYQGEEEWLIAWVRNSPGLIAKGDPKAVQLFEENDKQIMQAFTHLSEEQIKQILAYIKEVG